MKKQNFLIQNYRDQKIDLFLEKNIDGKIDFHLVQSFDIPPTTDAVNIITHACSWVITQSDKSRILDHFLVQDLNDPNKKHFTVYYQ